MKSPMEDSARYALPCNSDFIIINSIIIVIIINIHNHLNIHNPINIHNHINIHNRINSINPIIIIINPIIISPIIISPIKIIIIIIISHIISHIIIIISHIISHIKIIIITTIIKIIKITIIIIIIIIKITIIKIIVISIKMTINIKSVNNINIESENNINIILIIIKIIIIISINIRVSVSAVYPCIRVSVYQYQSYLRRKVASYFSETRHQDLEMSHVIGTEGRFTVRMQNINSGETGILGEHLHYDWFEALKGLVLQGSHKDLPTEAITSCNENCWSSTMTSIRFNPFQAVGIRWPMAK